MSIELGKFNTLRVVKEVDFGMYLDGGEEGEILLPSRYVPEECKPGDELTVFIYLDKSVRRFPQLGIDERFVCPFP